jgi:hypothetical protein
MNILSFVKSPCTTILRLTSLCRRRKMPSKRAPVLKSLGVALIRQNLEQTTEEVNTQKKN